MTTETNKFFRLQSLLSRGGEIYVPDLGEKWELYDELGDMVAQGPTLEIAAAFLPDPGIVEFEEIEIGGEFNYLDTLWTKTTNTSAKGLDGDWIFRSSEPVLKWK